MRRYFVFLALVAFALPSAAFSAWTKNCTTGICRIVTYMDIPPRSESEPVRMLLEVSEESIFVTALNTRGYHQKFYTTNPPTHFRVNGKDYVPTRTYFHECCPATLAVDGKIVTTLSFLNESQLSGSVGDIAAVIKAFRAGSAATLEYSSALRGRGQNVRFSLAGFSAALAGLGSETLGAGAKPITEDPRKLVAQNLKGNKFGVSVDELQTKPNPSGLGAFVWVPRTVFAGKERLFVWFVKDKVVLKLNSPTNDLTPTLPFPLDAPLSLWTDTGLSPYDCTSKGLKVAFGR